MRAGACLALRDLLADPRNNGCPECAKVIGPVKSKATKARKRREAQARVEAQIATLIPFDDLVAGDEPF